MIKNILVCTALALLAGESFASGTGYSTYPLRLKENLIGAEFAGVTSTGGGMGVQARYTHKLTSQVTLDAGIGMNGGDRNNSKLFASGDYEIYPDYGKQPRVSVRGKFESSEDYSVRKNNLTVAPTFSKGFSFWGKEAYPFVSIPWGLSLNTDTKEYSSIMSANFGINGNLPIRGYENLIGTLEATVNISGGYTGIFAGVSYPLK